MAYELSENIEELSSASNSILNYKPKLEKEFEKQVKADNEKATEKFVRDKDIEEAFDAQLKIQQDITDRAVDSGKKYYAFKDSRLEIPDILESKKRAVKNALEIVLDKLNAQTAAIFLLNKDGILERFFLSGYNSKGEEIQLSWFENETYEVKDNSFVGSAALPQEGSSYGMTRYSRDLSAEVNLDQEGKIRYTEMCGYLKSAIVVPLNGRSKTYGVLRVINRVLPTTKCPDNNSIFDKSEDVFWLSLLATNISNLLSDFKWDSHSKILEYFYHSLSSTPENIGSFYQKSVDLLVKTPETPFKAAILRLLNSNTQSLEVKAISLFKGVSNNRKNAPVKVGEGLAGWVAENRSPIVLSRIRLKDELVRVEDKAWINGKWIRENRFQSFGCFPLISQNILLGTLSFYTGYPYDFHEDINGFKFIRNIADLIATFIFLNSLPRIGTNKTIQREINHDDYDVFLAYSPTSSNEVERIASKLREKGIHPWLDQYKLDLGISWKDAVVRGLKDAKSVIIFIGKDEVALWQIPEIRAVIRNLFKKGIPINLVFLENVVREPRLPVFLEDLPFFDFRNGFDDALSGLVLSVMKTDATLK
jgi:hypothetical protein